MEDDFKAVHGLLTTVETGAVWETITDFEPGFEAERGFFAHGDFDATHVYHLDGRYTGIIDFGEIRGADRFYDLGRFALHDGESLPGLMLSCLLTGYRQIASLPPDHEQRIRLWSVLIGVRALARSGGRPWSPYQRHLLGAIRRSLAELVA